MRRANPSLTFALCASLAVHALAATYFIDRFARQSSHIWLPGSRHVLADASAPDADHSSVFGLADGSGDAPNTAAGEEPMVGRDGQTQALLSRDPVGAGRIGDDPSMSVLPKGASVAMLLAPPEAPAPVGLPAPEAPPPLPRVARDVPAPPAPSAGQDETSLVRTKETPVALSVPADATPGPRGADAPAADPAVMSDSESDPFSPSKGVEFRDGRVSARFGRKVKTVRPKLSLADQYDLLSMQFPRMTVRVHVDAEGAVRKVEIVKSSGSDSADQAVKVALYQWWFEPKQDERGRAVTDEVEFPISWR